MSFWSRVVSVVSSVASSVKSAASAAWQKAKEYGAMAIGWMATKAENFVGNIKAVWQRVKPYVEHFQTALRAAAAAAPWPWLKAVLVGVDVGLTALVDFEKSPVAKIIESAIKWGIALAQRLHGNHAEVELGDSELEEAERHRDTFRETAADLHVKDRSNFQSLGMLNDYAIASTKVARALASDDISDFQHYLRLRATQKLLQEARKTLDQAQTVQDITSDDRFLLAVADDLVKSNPTLTDESVKRLDDLLMRRHGKSLLTFAFEEMIVSWERRRMDLEKEWENTRDQYAKEKVALRGLETAKELAVGGVLDAKKQADLDRLSETCKARKDELEQRRLRELEMQTYVDAAEGFLQLQEKSEEELERENKDFLFDEDVGPKVGQLIIDCAEHGRAWSSLKPEDQNLLINFANVFRADCAKRVKPLVEIAA